MRKILITVLSLAFTVSGTIVHAQADAGRSLNTSSLLAASTNSKTDCSKKKNKNKKACKKASDKKKKQVNTVNSEKASKDGFTGEKGGIYFTSANWTGPWPAPEGMMLKGYLGKGSLLSPTGKSEHKFYRHDGFQTDLACMDDTRAYTISLGKSWQKGFDEGQLKGISDAKEYPSIFDDTPNGGENDLYNGGFLKGYDTGFNNRAVWHKDCQEVASNLSDFDDDGWKKYSEGAKLVYLKSYLLPPYPFVKLIDRNRSILKGMVYGFEQDVTKNIASVDLNKSSEPVNLSEIEFYDSQSSPFPIAAINDPVEKAQSYYETAFPDLNCTNNLVAVKEKKYGNNIFGKLEYNEKCQSKNFSHVVFFLGGPEVNKGLLEIYELQKKSGIVSLPPAGLTRRWLTIKLIKADQGLEISEGFLQKFLAGVVYQ